MRIRLKLGAIVLSLVVLLLVAVYLFVIGPIRRELTHYIRTDVVRATEQLAEMSRNDGRAASQIVEHLAAESRLVSAVETPCELVSRRDDCVARQHRDTAAAIETWLIETGNPESRAAFPSVEMSLAVAARLDGFVLARSIGDVFDWWGDNAINLTDAVDLAAASVSDNRTHWSPIVWSEQSGASEVAMLAAATTIRGRDGQPIGVVLLGWPLNDQMASLRAETLDRTILYTLDGTVTGTSSQEVFANLENATFALAGSRDASEPSFAELLSTGRANHAYRGSRTNQNYVISRNTLPSSLQNSARIGFAVVADLGAELGSLERADLWLLLSALIITLFGLIGVVIVADGFVKPIVRIEHGIQQVIAGNREHIWQTEKAPLHDQLAQSLNSLSAVLQGKTIPDEGETEEDKSWEAMLHFAELESTGQRVPKQEFSKPRIPGGDEIDEAQPKVAAEPEGPYLQQLFEDYVAARSEVGVGSERISHERFIAQVKKNSALFKRKYDCKDVRFKVVVKDGKVVLKPIPIK